MGEEREKRERGFCISAEYSRRGGFWTIRDLDRVTSGGSNYPGEIIWERGIRKEDEGMEPYPPDVCKEYERLMGKPEFLSLDDDRVTRVVNIVEIIAEGASGFNQACRFGYLVDGHAVYCHNDRWLYAPRKCRRSWYTGGESRDQDCRGYEPHQKEQGI